MDSPTFTVTQPSLILAKLSACSFFAQGRYSPAQTPTSGQERPCHQVTPTAPLDASPWHLTQAPLPHSLCCDTRSPRWLVPLQACSWVFREKRQLQHHLFLDTSATPSAASARLPISSLCTIAHCQECSFKDYSSARLGA